MELNRQGQRPESLSIFPGWRMALLPLRSHSAQPGIPRIYRVEDLNRRPLKIKEGGELPGESVRRVPGRRNDGGVWNRFLAEVDARPLDGINQFARRDVEVPTGKFEELVIVVHAVLHAGRDIRREVIDGQRSRADGVNLLPLVVDGISEWHNERTGWIKPRWPACNARETTNITAKINVTPRERARPLRHSRDLSPKA